MVWAGYEPLNTLKPVADGLWLIDGPAHMHRGIPHAGRATVARLASGGLWVHSPTPLTDALQGELAALGPVTHLVAPNLDHLSHIGAWQRAYPAAQTWAVPGAAERAAHTGRDFAAGVELDWDQAEAPWQGELEQMIVRGSPLYCEAAFFHRASKTLILTDLIHAHETALFPVWRRPRVWIAGVDDRDGKRPYRMAVSYGRDALVESVERMIDWGPERIILSHGRWYRENGVAELRRAFRRVLRSRGWDRALRGRDVR